MRLSSLNPYRGLRGLPIDVWIIFATTFVNRAGMMALPFLILYLTKYLGVPASLAGFAISAYGLGGLVTGPIAGRLADRLGSFVVIGASLALSGIMLLLMPLVHQFVVFLGLTFVWAVIADAARPAIMSALTSSGTPEQRKAAIALNRLAINLGMSIGPAVGGFLAMLSFPLLFVVDGLTSLAAAAVLATLLWIRHRKPTSTFAPQHADTATVSKPAFSKRSTVWRDRAALLFFLTSFMVSLAFVQHEGAMPLYLVRDLHYRESFYGLLFVVNTAIIIAIEVPLNLAMAHWPVRRSIPLAAMLVATGFGALGFAHGPIAIAMTVVIWTFGEMILFPAATAYVAELAPAGRTGEYMGVFGATFSLALIIGPWAGAALLDRYGPIVTWSSTFVCGLVGAAVFAISQRPAAVAAEARGS